MNAVINFQMIGKIDQYTFELPYRDFAASLDSKLLFMGVDQYSDRNLMKYILNAAAEAERVLLILSGDEHADLKNLHSMSEWVMSNKKKIFVLDLVNNTLSSRWSKILNDQYCADMNEEIKKQFVRNALQVQK